MRRRSIRPDAWIDTIDECGSVKIFAIHLNIKEALPNFDVFEAVVQVEQGGPFFFVKFPVTCVRLLNIQGVSGGIVNILWGGIMDYSE